MVSIYGMDVNRLFSLLAVPLAGIFLILILCTFAMRKPVSTGIRIPVIRLHHDPNEPTDCGGRSEFIRLTRDGRTWINEDEIPRDQLVPKIAELMESRVERAVYVVVDSEMSYGQFAEFLGQVAGAATDLHVVVVSGEVRRALE